MQNQPQIVSEGLMTIVEVQPVKAVKNESEKKPVVKKAGSTKTTKAKIPAKPAPKAPAKNSS